MTVSSGPMYWETGSVGRPRRSDDGRSPVRIAMAAIAAGGLVFSASLVHLPGQRSPLEFWQQDHGSLSNLPVAVGSIAAKQLIDLAGTELPTLAHLADLLSNNFPAVPADVLVSAVQKHGLPQILRTLEVLASAGLSVQASAALFGGGGGSSPVGPPMSPSDLEELLQYLMHQLPAALVQGFTDIIAALIPFPASLSATQGQQVTHMLAVSAPPVAVTSPPSAVVVPPPPAVATSAPPAAPPTPTVAALPSVVETPPPPTVEVSVSVTPPPITDDVTPVPEPATEVVNPPHEDDLGRAGGDGDLAPGAGSEEGSEDGHSGGQDGNDANGGMSNAGGDGSAGATTSGGSSGDAGGASDNGSGGSQSAGSGTGGD